MRNSTTQSTFAIQQDTGDLDELSPKEFSDLDILERYDLQEWIIKCPRLLGDDYLVITSEFAGFEETRDRLDILALDRDGQLVVIELKRDRADALVDLQAIKYASYCATLTAKQIQEEYRKFWSDRDDADYTPEGVGDKFSDFLELSIEDELNRADDGSVEFSLDNKPRILLAAREFGLEVTSPVIWLIEEFGLDITCVQLEAFEHAGDIIMQGREIIPVPEAEEYMTKRREKEEKQSNSSRRKRGILALLERGVLVEGDILLFNPSKWDDSFEREYEEDNDYWRAEVTGNTGQSDNVKWLHDGQEYSFTRLSKKIMKEQTEYDSGALNGYKFWVHPEFDNRRLSQLRNTGVEARERRKQSS